jgi:uncharacterized membrane protein
MNEYLIVKWLHVLSSTLLFGTGIGTAFHMFFANRSRDPRAIAVVNRNVVIADWLFTATTVVLQPLTGWWLVRLAGLPMSTPWIMWSFVLHGVAVACWLPVVWIQMRMRDMAIEAAAARRALPDRYWQLERIWVLLGIPAFLALVTVFYLMVVKPS